MSAGRFLSRDARNLRPSAIRAFAKLINDPNVISFAGGVPNPETFPAGELAAIAERMIREKRAISLQYGPTRGLPRLCDAIAAICRTRSIDCTADDILTTTGSQQALDLIAHVLLDPGDVVLVELPTYIGGTASFFGRSAELAGVEQDDDGIVPASLREVATRLKGRVKLLYTIPNFQNPSGRLMTQSRRDAVLAIAAEHDFLVIEDDPYGELVYVDGADTTPMRSRDDRVIYLGSFSKILAPGLRCGWILAPRELLATLEIAKQAADLCSAMLDQSIVDELIANGSLPAQIDKVRAFYRGKRNILIEELALHFTGRAKWTSADGGLFTFVTLDDDVDTTARVEEAVRRGVAYIPGAPFFVDGRGRNTMRLTFAKEGDAKIREGVARLAGVFA